MFNRIRSTDRATSSLIPIADFTACSTAIKMSRLGVVVVSCCCIALVFASGRAIYRAIIATPNAPNPAGPFSQAILVDRTVYVTAQQGKNVATGQIVRGGAGPETEQALKNIGFIVDAAGGNGLRDVVKLTNYLKDMRDLKAVNEAYEKVFGDKFPARATFQVAALPADGQIEIDAIAVVVDGRKSSYRQPSYSYDPYV